eukprot:TRINITY_DN106810_c0_g1_i1.p1 TRINITY_DN106810_c0_g1~~TRINITY_DN106810_c0_g1_i1.p1  ORF type:complete len:688 (-),score=166.97 TRINITY_DN106810_c0_g1_i1:59-2122(-)
MESGRLELQPTMAISRRMQKWRLRLLACVAGIVWLKVPSATFAAVSGLERTWQQWQAAGEVAVKSQNFSRALHCFESAINTLEEDSSAVSRESAALRMKLGSAHTELGKFQDALRTYRTVHKQLHVLGKLSGMEGAGLMLKVGAAQEAQGKPAKALEAYQEALKALRALDKIRSRPGACLLARLGAVFAAQGDWAEAVKQLKAARSALEVCTKGDLVNEGHAAARLLADLANAHAGIAGLAAPGLGPLGLLAVPGAGYAAKPSLASALGSARPPVQDRLRAEESGDERLGELQASMYLKSDSTLGGNIGSTRLSREQHIELAFKTYDAAKSIFQALGTLDSSAEGASLLTAIGDVRAAMGQWSAALQQYKAAEDALALWRASPNCQDELARGAASAQHARLMARIGGSHGALGAGQDALNARRQGLQSFHDAGLGESVEAGRLLMDLGMDGLHEAEKAVRRQRADLWEQEQVGKKENADRNTKDVGATNAEAVMEVEEEDEDETASEVTEDIRLTQQALEDLKAARRVFESQRKLGTKQGARLLAGIGEAQLRLGNDMKALNLFEASRKIMAKTSYPHYLFFDTPEGKSLVARIKLLFGRCGVTPWDLNPEKVIQKSDEKDKERKPKRKLHGEWLPPHLRWKIDRWKSHTRPITPWTQRRNRPFENDDADSDEDGEYEVDQEAVQFS